MDDIGENAQPRNRPTQQLEQEEFVQLFSPIKHIHLTEREVTIGRATDNMVCLHHPGVSAHHARIERVGESYHLIDLGSTNHIYVNGKREKDYLLQTNDKVRIGPYVFVYTDGVLDAYDESYSIGIRAYHLTKKIDNKVLLDDISLVIPARKFVAIVGASGTGKSTLLKALCGLDPAEGSVFYNDDDYYKSLAAFSTQIGYVPQDDIVHADLTVKRALYFGAKLRLPSDYTEEQIVTRVDEVLRDVELSEDKHNLFIHKLSGGQRKRVSIALELLANPSVFFLDEPTSGLDPGLDLTMMRLLRKLADNGQTIVMVTHATTNIAICDYICFLAEGGRLAYFGPPLEAQHFFQTTNFAEIYEALDSGRDITIAQKTEERFRASYEYQTYIAGPLSQREVQTENAVQRIQPPKHIHALRQFVLLSRRYLELLKNDRVNLTIILLQAPIITMIFSMLFKWSGRMGLVLLE